MIDRRKRFLPNEATSPPGPPGGRLTRRLLHFVVSGIVAIVLVFVGIDTAADVTAKSDSTSDPMPQDIVYYHNEFPIFIRLHLESDGDDFVKPWRCHVSKLYQQVDRDGDGGWTTAEVKSAAGSSPGEMLSTIVKMPDLWTADDNPFDRQITQTELERFLVLKQMGPFQPPGEIDAALGNSIQGRTLFSAMDANDDGSLTREEFLNASKALHRHDLNDDGSYSLAELSSQVGRQPTAFGRPEPQSSRLPIAALTAGASLTDVVREIERRYGNSEKLLQGPETSDDLNSEQLNLDPEAFSKFDVDASGALDSEELRRFLRNPVPTLELRVQLGGDVSFAESIQVVSSSTDSVSLRKTTDLVSIVAPGIQIELSQNQSGIHKTKQYILQNFTAADRDGNGYLEEKEVVRNAVFRSAFDELDADGNGKLFQNEVIMAIDAQTAIAKTRTRMSLSDRGRNLFQILDSDRNSTLGPREFVRAANRIMLWDENGDEQIASAEIPRIFRMSLGPGQPEFRGMQLPDFESPGIRKGLTGPIWFQKMDRNNDSELSRREFPGTRAEFQRLDANNDGMVDALEAGEAAGISTDQQDVSPPTTNDNQ